MTKKTCTAKTRSGGRCKAAPMAGTTVCRMHGGMAPQVKAAAARRVAEAEAEAWVIANIADAPPLASVREVYAELLAVAGQARRWRELLGQRVAGLQTLGYEGLQAEQVRADVQLFERSMDRSAKVCELVARLDLDSRITALTEADGLRVAAAIRHILAALDMADDPRVGEVVPAALARVVGEGS